MIRRDLRWATLEQVDSRRGYGERRIIALGRAQGIPLTVVYSGRAEAGGEINRRIISARKSNRREREAYKHEVDRSCVAEPISLEFVASRGERSKRRPRRNWPKWRTVCRNDATVVEPARDSRSLFASMQMSWSGSIVKSRRINRGSTRCFGPT